MSLDEHNDTFEQRMSDHGYDQSAGGGNSMMSGIGSGEGDVRNPFDDFDPRAEDTSDPFGEFGALPEPAPLKPAAVRRSESIEETKIEGVLRVQTSRKLVGKWQTMYFVAAKASTMRWNGVGFNSQSYLLRSFKVGMCLIPAGNFTRAMSSE